MSVREEAVTLAHSRRPVRFTSRRYAVIKERCAPSCHRSEEDEERNATRRPVTPEITPTKLELPLPSEGKRARRSSSQIKKA
jgi:hypothetical protein